MQTSASRFLELLSPDAPIEGPGITIVPLVRSGEPTVLFVSLKRAFDAGALTVTEVSQGGSVPDLSVTNSGETAVLMVDGEELVGAKQNRMLNTTIMVDARGKLVVPVSCTEAGRWHYNDPQFKDSGYVAPRSVRVPKSMSVHESLKAMKAHRSDQGEVWDQVAFLHASMGTVSETGALRDAMEQKRVTLDEAMAAFRPIPNQVGFVAVCSDGFVGMDAVSRPEVYADLHEKLVRSYVADLVARGQAGKVALNGQMDAFLAAVAAADAERFKSPGMGEDERLVSASVGGSSLVVADEIVHLGAFTKPSGAGQDRPVPEARMRRGHWRL